ncbi:MAG: LacI family DNA-binding transcriptional regulator [Sinorhizobium meliloti]|jgi:LacI family transcriptional regulator|uniref:LacI family transcriptional regulator n=1 Tax=Rhizobium meliloti TaxID=382 RepID=A0A2J0Z6M7_RHIML|nr:MULTISPECIES: LacI family DNA-binding transcriptional regulator [Sinorhizobium]GCA50656.1 catabolite control protein A [Sinorhizobium sp. KGO-5]MCG5487014.1 LacI family DNA-binding transcriptional regulator [Sinorhizobium meliloti]PJR16160.1 LacI family transcriptional regulator [Sinorhizobium meliloti]RVQ02421.1 LacI family DNA-binding transcriptional regulator [Sinorhizobium meliloti]WEJ13370.1 LacI family DNA-binding transcriptional regulator [Sinorhizobium sp. M103]
MQRPTIKTIARETGLSIATVSKALKHSPQVRPETRAIVLDAAERVGYELNLHGVQLRTGKTYQVAAIMTAPGPKENEWEGVEYAQLLSGISWALEESPYRVSLYAVRDFEESQETIRQIVAMKKADGIIISGTRADDPRIRLMQEAEFPFVTYGMSIHNAPHAYVDADNAQMIRLSMARLIERGHRRIALLNPKEQFTYGVVRLESYRKALEEAGLSYDAALVAHGRLTPAFGRENVVAMSALADPPTAYICANEATALGAFSGFHARGLVHGRDAVINATDDLNVSQYFAPPITSYYLPIGEPSALLGKFILRRMEGEPPEALQTLLMPDLIERSDDRLRPKL